MTEAPSRTKTSTNRRHFLGGAMGLAGLLGIPGTVHRVTAEEATAAATAVDDYVWEAPDWNSEPKVFDVIERNEDSVLIETINGEIEIPANPQRVVCLDSEHILFYLLGVTENIVGIDVQPQTGLPVPAGELTESINNTFADVTKVGSAWEPDLELVLSLEPDLVFGFGTWLNNDVYDTISQLSPFVLEAPQHFTAPRESLRLFGKLLGLEAKADEILSSHEEFVERARERVAPLIGNHQVALVEPMADGPYIIAAYSLTGDIDFEPGKPMAAAVPYTVYRELGFTPCSFIEKLADDNGRNSSYYLLSYEQVGLLDADYIFVVNRNRSDDENAVVNEFVNHPVTQTTKAAQNDRVIVLSQNVGFGLPHQQAAIKLVVETLTGESFE